MMCHCHGIAGDSAVSTILEVDVETCKDKWKQIQDCYAWLENVLSTSHQFPELAMDFVITIVLALYFC